MPPVRARRALTIVAIAVNAVMSLVIAGSFASQAAAQEPSSPETSPTPVSTDPEPDTATSEPAPTPISTDPEPDAVLLPIGVDDREWVQLVSGEWISGNIEHMRDEMLEFDSDELDMLTIDWEDVAAFYAPSHNRYALEGRRMLSGPASMAGGVLTVQTESGDVSVHASQVLAILEGEVSEWNRWRLELSASLSASLGNAEQST